CTPGAAPPGRRSERFGLAVAGAGRTATGPGSALDVDDVALDENLIAGDIRRHRTAEELARARVEGGVVQPALDDVAVEPSLRQRGLPVATGVRERAEGAVDVGDEDALAVDGHPRHLAGRQLGHPGHRHEPVAHAAVLRRVSSGRTRTAAPHSP